MIPKTLLLSIAFRNLKTIFWSWPLQKKQDLIIHYFASTIGQLKVISGKRKNL